MTHFFTSLARADMRRYDYANRASFIDGVKHL